MDNEKQIEEMTQIIDNVQTYGTKWYPDKYEPFDCRIENDDIAYELYNAGCRKIPEGAVVLTKEEKQKLLHGMYEQGKFDGVVKFAEMVKKRKIEMGTDGHSYCMVFVDDIDEICKEIIKE